MEVKFGYVGPPKEKEEDVYTKPEVGSTKELTDKMCGLKTNYTDGIRLVGLIASDTFKRTGATHFADMDGNVSCGAKCRFGMDCHTEIRIVDFDNFETDRILKFNEEDKMGLRKNHLPMDAHVSCKTCQKNIKKLLNGKIDSRN